MSIDLSNIDERPALLLRQGITLLITDLEKKRDGLEKLDKLHYSTRMIDADVELCRHLDRALDAQGDAVADSAIGKRETHDPAQHAGQMSIDEAIDSAEQDAAKAARHRNVVSAISGIVGPKPDGLVSAPDDALHEDVIQRFAAVEYVDADGDAGEKRWPGIYRHMDLDTGRAVWCAVHTDDGALAVVRFWYDIDPELVKFNPEALAPTLLTKGIVAAVREAWDVPDPAELERLRAADVRSAMLSILPQALDDDLRAVVDQDPDELANVLAAHVDNVLENAPQDGVETLPAGFFMSVKGVGFFTSPAAVGEEQEAVLCYARGGSEMALWYDVPQDFDPVQPGRAPDLSEADIMEVARERLFPAAAANEAPAEEQSPDDWANVVRPRPEPHAKKHVTTEMCAQVVHSVLIVQAPEGAAGWFEFRQQPRTNSEIEERIRDIITVLGKGDTKFSGTEAVGISSDADAVQMVPYEFSTAPLRLVCGRGKADSNRKQVLDGDAVLLLVRGLFDILIAGTEETTLGGEGDVALEEETQQAETVGV